jgi:adenylosuccinate synthase
MEKKVDWAIRTGTVNAGHTVYHKGVAYAMQQLPVSWVRPECMLVLGPGAYIHPDILMREIEWIMEAQGLRLDTVLDRVWIDYRCGIHLPSHTDRAHHADRHHSIGTTGKGCSEAVMDKIKGRDQDPLPTFQAWVADKPGFWQNVARRITDTTVLMNDAYDAGDQILLEGTQGTLLDLHLGDYPFTTHKQTQAASWLAEAGLSCTLQNDLWLVMRTYPIRVAGNSGPMPGEISWPRLANLINDRQGIERVGEWALSEWNAGLALARANNYPEAPSPEPACWTQQQRQENREAASELHNEAFKLMSTKAQAELCKLFEFTTVTKKLRRIGEWDWNVAQKSLMLNRPHHIALTFANYKWPKLWGADWKRAWEGYSQWGEWVDILNTFSRKEAASGPVGMISFGPQIEHTHMDTETAR